MGAKRTLMALGPAITVALAAAIAYSNITGNEPVLDDSWVIFENPVIRSLGNLGRIFREPYNVAGAETTAGLYRPITTLTYALNYALGGKAVLGYHVVNIALHVACALLVFLLARRLASARSDEATALRIGWLAALVFAVHPAHVEAVTGMVGRAELLAALFSLACLYLACTRLNAWWRLPLGLVCLAAGVLSKESAAITPALFLLIARFVPEAADLGDRKMRSAIVTAALMSAAVSVYVILKLSGPGGLGVPLVAQYFQGAPRTTVAITMTQAFAEYLRILVFPVPLGLDFFYRVRVPTTDSVGLRVIASTLVWGSAAVLAFRLRKREPLIALGVLWIYVALIPVSNVIVPVGTHIAERFLYLPSAGFAIAAAAMLVRLPKLDRARGWRDAFVAMWLATLLGLALVRNLDWRNQLTLWQAEYALVPDDPVVNNSLASALDAAGDYQSGRAHAEKATRLAPGSWAAWVNLGIASHSLGDDRAAASAFDTAARIAPSNPSPRFFHATMLLDGGDLDGAIRSFADAARLAPEDSRSALWLGKTLYFAGRWGEAQATLQRAAALDPADASPHGYLALVAHLVHDAVKEEEESARFGLSTSGLAFESGERLARARACALAIPQYRLALELYPTHSRALYAIGLCEEALGRKDEAKESYAKALSISPAFTEAKSALERVSAP